MTKDECYYLGKITRTNGHQGGLSIYLDVDNPQEYAGLDALFVDYRGSLIPYFIDKMQLHTSKNTAVVYLEDVDGIDMAQSLVNSLLYLPTASLPKLEGTKFYFHEVIGFNIIEKTFGLVGKCDHILDYPQQALFQVFHEKKEVLIPIKKDFILEVDREKKEILMELPLGLLDVYLAEEE